MIWSSVGIAAFLCLGGRRANSHRVNAREISAFGRIAPVACKGKIRRIIGTAVLARDDVLHLERRKRELVLSQTAVLTAIARSATDKLKDRGILQPGGGSVR